MLQSKVESILCCSHAAHLDPTITATHRPVASQPQSQKFTGSYQCQATAGPPTRRGPALPLGHFGGVHWCLSIGPPTNPPTDDSNCSAAEPD
ncbi:hypothetical protein ACOMHN_005671 [Nucella lapillus]